MSKLNQNNKHLALGTILLVGLILAGCSAKNEPIANNDTSVEINTIEPTSSVEEQAVSVSEQETSNEEQNNPTENNDDYLIEIDGTKYTKEQFFERTLEYTHSVYTIESMEGLNGEVVYFEYNEKSRISKKTDQYEVIFTLNDYGYIEDEIVNGDKMVTYSYDNSFMPYSITYADQTYYYYIEDRIIYGLMDEHKEMVCKYSYDELGKIKDIYKYVDGDIDISEYNHLLYRGYYYDAETGLYFAKGGGYYNPENGKIFGLTTSVDLEGLFGDKYEEMFGHGHKQ